MDWSCVGGTSRYDEGQREPREAAGRVWSRVEGEGMLLMTEWPAARAAHDVTGREAMAWWAG